LASSSMGSLSALHFTQRIATQIRQENTSA
jgi:hypothetical protein